MPQWIKLESFPFCFFGPPFSVNDNEFVIVSSKLRDSNYNGSEGIYKYNINTNKMSKIINYDNVSLHSTDISVAFNGEEEIIYVCNIQNELLAFDLRTKSMQILSTKARFGKKMKIIYVNDTLHIIGGYYNNKHLIFNKDSKQFKVIHEFKENDMIHHNVLYMKSRKSLLLFGAANNSKIYEYFLETNKWNILNIHGPNPLFGSTVVSTKNEQHIIVFGGYCTKDIVVYDFKTKNVAKSLIKCQNSMDFYGILISDPSRDELLLFGFINHCFNLPQFIDIQTMPQYLIKLIGHWISTEYVHLIQYGSRSQSAKHWKINVDIILQSIQ